jgi:integrase
MPKVINRLEVLLVKYKDKGFTNAVSFLSSLSRRSKQTAFAYYYALGHLNKFISQTYGNGNGNGNDNIQTILKPLEKGKINVYTLLDKFVEYLQQTNNNNNNIIRRSNGNGDLTDLSIKLYVTAARSYFSYSGIDVIPSKFKYMVKMPRIYREDELAIDAKDIRQILLACNNRRLKAYLLCLASSGCRAVELLSLRLKDVNFSTNPTTLHIRKEFAKTGSARDVYISDEASNFLQKQWIDWKYRDRHSEHRYMKNRVKDDNDLIFAIIHAKHPSPRVLYFKILIEFQKVLDTAGFIARKEGCFKRRKVSLHSFRRFVKSTISNQVGYEYSEWFLGHATKSTYYQLKEEQRRSIYRHQLMKYFTYLDYSALEATGQNVKKQLLEKDIQIEQLKQHDASNSEAIAKLQNMFTKLVTSLSSDTTDQNQLNVLAKSLAASGILKPKTNSNDDDKVEL